MTTKVILTAADEDTAIAVDVVPGPANDAPLLEPMVDATIARVPHFDEVGGDRGFDGYARRAADVDRNLFPNIPSRSSRREPQPFLPDAYRERNWVQRLFAELKQHRRVATRYDKLKPTYLGMVHLALGCIRLKRSVSVNTAWRVFLGQQYT